LPAETHLRVRRIAEIAVVVVAQRDVRFQVLHDRDVELGVGCPLLAVLVARRLYRPSEAGDVSALEGRIHDLVEFLLSRLDAERQRKGTGRELVDFAGRRRTRAVVLRRAVERVADEIGRALERDHVRCVRTEEIDDAAVQDRQ